MTLLDEYINPEPKKTPPTFLIIFSIAILAGIFTFSLYALTNYSRNLDKRGCLEIKGPSHLLIVLIDASDPYSETEKRNIWQTISGKAGLLKSNTLLQIVTFDENNILEPKVIFDKCSAGPISPTFLERMNTRASERKEDWQESLGDPLAEQLSIILESESQDYSPITEVLIEVSKNAMLDSITGDKRVMLFSDMLQNTSVRDDGWSMLPEVAKNQLMPFEETTLFARLKDRANNTALDIYVMERIYYIEIQNDVKLYEYWENVSERLGFIPEFYH